MNFRIKMSLFHGLIVFGSSRTSTEPERWPITSVESNDALRLHVGVPESSVRILGHCNRYLARRIKWFTYQSAAAI